MLENLKLGPRYDGFLFLAETARNPPVLQPHHHIELELNVIVRGTVTYVVGGRRFTFSRRTLLWMFPAQEHQLVDRSKDAQYYVAVFKPKLIAQACRGSGYEGLKKDKWKEEGVLHTELEPEAFDLIRKTMDLLVADGLDPELLNREAGFGISTQFSFAHSDPDALNAGLRHLLLLSWRYQQKQLLTDHPVTLHPAVRKALHLLGDEEWEHKLALLAQQCGVSEAYLSRLFARQIGVSLSRYRNSTRLARFLKIYRQPDGTTLTEAMYAAGFGSYAQFHRIFVQAYGSGPREVLQRKKPKVN